jgi:uncharacterized protein with HEPN domain
VNDRARVERLLADLDATLISASALVTRGREAFDHDPALPLAFEALVNRVGDLAKRLTVADPECFDQSIWRAAARTRGFVVHHYDRIDLDVLWQTVSVSLPQLHEEVRAQRSSTL